MFIRYLLGGLAFLCLGYLPAQTFSSAAVDSLFAEWNSLDQPGAVVGIFLDGEIIYQKGYGSANLEHQIPITPTTVFRVGSVSKQFTAACFLLLVQEGKVTLDTKLPHFYPDFPAYGKDITMAHLLNHTSGIRDYDQLVQYSPTCDFDCFYEEDLLALLYRQKALNSPPGTSFQYTNSGYWLLGQIVGKISGQSLAEFAQDRLFTPLKMDQTHFSEDYTLIVSQKAHGYEEDDESEMGYWWYNTTNSIVGDGGLMTSVADFKQWDDAFYQRAALSDTFWDLALARSPLPNGDTLSYAAGFDIVEHDGWTLHKHNGNAFGFCATYFRVPAAKLSVVILSNRGEAYSIDQKAANILEMTLPSRSPILSSGQDALPLSSSVQEIPFSSYVGHYWNERKFLARLIHQRGDTLFYGKDAENGYPIYPHEAHSFKADNGLVFQFEPNAQGAYQLNIFQFGKHLSNLQRYEPVSQGEVKVREYTGRYWSEELLAEYQFVQDGEYLIWYSEGEAVAPLLPVFSDTFQTPGGTVFSFIRGKESKVNDCTMSNQRLRKIVFTRK